MFYNPYPQYTGYSPYNSQAPAVQPPLQQEQVTQVNGRASVEQIQLAPNSSKLVMDTTAPIVWLCVSDGVGRVTATPYDITEHKDAPPIDVEGIEGRLANVEAAIKQILEGGSYGKSNAGTSAATSTAERSNYNGGKRAADK